MTPDRKRLGELLAQSARQLDRAKELLAQWKLDDRVFPALNWVARYGDRLVELSDEMLSRMAPAIEGQQAVLFAAVGSIQELAGMVRNAVDGPDGAITGVLRAYATAAGESHLIEAARQQLAAADRLKAQLPLALVGRQLVEADASIRDLAAGEGMPSMGTAQLRADYDAEHRQVLELQQKYASGAAIDPGDVDLVGAKLENQSFEANVRTVVDELANLGNAARDAGFGFSETLASLWSSEFRALAGNVFAMRSDVDENVLQATRRRRDANLNDVATRATKPGSSEDKSARAFAIRDALRSGRASFDAWLQAPVAGTDRSFKQVIADALAVIQRQQLRTAVTEIVIQIAVMIGVSVIGGAVGELVGGVARGLVVGDAAADTLSVMRVGVAEAAGLTANMTADAAINAGAQRMLSGDGFSGSFVENLIANGALRAALRPLHAVAEAWGSAGRDVEQVATWAEHGGTPQLTVKSAALLTADMLTGIAVNYVVHRMLHGGVPDEQTALDWAIQGGTMAIGSFIGFKLSGMHARLAKAGEEFAQVRSKLARVEKIAKLAAQHGDRDAGMELLVEHRELLDEEQRAISAARKTGRLKAQTLDALDAANMAARGALADKAFGAMPLRLGGLQPDDASGKVWVGSTEQIAVALHQAKLAGLGVSVLEHDVAARRWRVIYNNEELTILETALEGRPRDAKSPVTEADRLHARRYAEAAEFLLAQWEARSQEQLDARFARGEVVAFESVQVGHAQAGVMNQATQPAGDHLVIYRDRGPMAKRGAQELGQAPDKWDAPGLRASEQADAGDERLRADALDRSIAVGQLETQAPVYRAEVTRYEVRRPDDAGWKAPERKLRVTVHTADGDHVIYCDHCDDVSGAGPSDLSTLGSIVPPDQLAGLLGSGRVLAGDDPEFASRLRDGRVLVIGGSPTGAWAAEAAAQHGSDVTVVGDSRAASWPELFAAYNDAVAEIAAQRGSVPAELEQRLQQLEGQMRRLAHKGAALPRNSKPGAAYGPDSGVHIEFGTASRISQASDGRVLVTVGSGDAATTTIYDQVINARGQKVDLSPQLGAGAAAKDHEVPSGTIALKPIWAKTAGHAEPDLVGVESVDPAGAIQLKGARYATDKIAPWIVKGERAAFEAGVRRMTEAHAPTRDYGDVGDESTGVPSGIEHQRDKLPRANEILGARTYRLPGPEQTLEARSARPRALGRSGARVLHREPACRWPVGACEAARRRAQRRRDLPGVGRREQRRRVQAVRQGWRGRRAEDARSAREGEAGEAQTGARARHHEGQRRWRARQRAADGLGERAEHQGDGRERTCGPRRAHEAGAEAQVGARADRRGSRRVSCHVRAGEPEREPALHVGHGQARRRGLHDQEEPRRWQHGWRYRSCTRRGLLARQDRRRRSCVVRIHGGQGAGDRVSRRREHRKFHRVDSYERSARDRHDRRGLDEVLARQSRQRYQDRCCRRRAVARVARGVGQADERRYRGAPRGVRRALRRGVATPDPSIPRRGRVRCSRALVSARVRLHRASWWRRGGEVAHSHAARPGGITMSEGVLRCPRCGSTEISLHGESIPPRDEGEQWHPSREEAYWCHGCDLLERAITNNGDDYEKLRVRWGEEPYDHEAFIARKRAYIAEQDRQEEEDARAYKWPREHQVTDAATRREKLAAGRRHSDYRIRSYARRKETLPEHVFGYPIGDEHIADVLRDPDDDAPRWAYAKFLRGFETEAAQKSAVFIEWELRMAEAFRKDPRADLRSQLPYDNTFDLPPEVSKGTPFEMFDKDPEVRYWWRVPGAATQTQQGDGMRESLLPLYEEGLIDDRIFFRGFIEHVAIRASRFLEIADELYSRAPIRHLTLTYCKGVDHTDTGLWKELLASPQLERIRSLRIPARSVYGNRYTRLNRLDNADMEVLAASTRLRGLRCLDLSDETYINQPGLDALASSPNVPRLNALLFPVYTYSQPTFSWGPMGEIVRKLSLRVTDECREALEAKHGRIEWLHVAENYGSEEPDPEALVEFSVRG